jgi:hypothetical protein
VTGASNMAIGSGALYSNTTAADNTASGAQALFSNTGVQNTADGRLTLFSNVGGDHNTAVGYQALWANTSGSDNVGVGENAGAADDPNVSGSGNTFVGSNAGSGSAAALSNATALGANAIVSRSDSIVLGASNVNAGVHTSTPQSALQIGSGATQTPGDYLQIPVLLSTAKTPPVADCDNTTLVGRIVLLAGKKMIFFACSPAGVWVKV